MLTEYLDEMKTLALRSGVLISDYELLYTYGDLDSLDDLRTLAWKPAYRTWVLPVQSNPDKADQYWANLDALELTTSREHSILNPQLKELYRAFKIQIREARKSYNNSLKENSKGINTRP